MLQNNSLPQLPLMLAGVPRSVVELLCEAGVPAAALPRVPAFLPGVGRFVLYSSKNAASARRAARAQSQGLETLDISQFEPSVFLSQLKTELENRGGVWLRLADYPFPYQGVLCVGVEHTSGNARDFREFVAEAPCGVTHFVSPRLDLAGLLPLAKQQVAEFGWILEEDAGGGADEVVAAGLLADWKPKMRQFRAAGYAVRGLAVNQRSRPLPLMAGLWALGLRYSASRGRKSGCHVELNAGGAWRPEWLRFEAISGAAEAHHTPAPIAAQVVSESGTILSVVPPEELGVQIGRRLRRYYQAGLPIFLQEAAAQWEATAVWVQRACTDKRLPLLWRATFTEFARWRRSRKNAAVRVWRSDGKYEIEAVGDIAKYPPAVELWRRDHVATLPLSQARISLPEDGLVFSQSHRNPAGLAGMSGAAALGPPARRSQRAGVV